MDTDFLRCDQCSTVLTGESINTPAPVPCPGCEARLLNRVFPAFFQPPAFTNASLQESVSSDEDASCFFHPRKKAVRDCGSCGRFLCALCDLDLEGRHLCPTCVANSRGKGSETDKVLQRDHMRYDYLALSLTIYPVILPILWFAVIGTAPAALYYVIRYWKTPGQALLPRSHARQIVAATLAILQIAGLVLGVVYLQTRPGSGTHPFLR